MMKLRKTVIISILLAFAGCGGSTAVIQEPEPGLSTGQVDIQYSNGYFTSGAFRSIGTYLYFFSKKGADKLPSNYVHTIYLKAIGGTIQSGQKSAYTWSATGLPNWLVLNTTDPNYVSLSLADDPNNPGMKLYPANYTAGQVVGFNIINGGSGYSSAPSVVINGNGMGATAIAGIAGGVVTSITINEEGAGYTTEPTVVFNGANINPAQAQAVIGKPIPITITATSNEGKSKTVQTTLLVLNNRQTGAASGSLQYLHMGNAYSGTLLAATENATDDDTLNVLNDINGTCQHDVSGQKYQAILPGQQILANGGTVGKDCFAFHVPANNFKVSFTIQTKTGTDNINACNFSAADPKCEFVFVLKDFPLNSTNVFVDTESTGVYLGIAQNTSTIYTIRNLGNSLYDPYYQKIQAMPPTWRFSYYFSSQNAIPSTFVANSTQKCNPNAVWTTNFESETFCADNPKSPGSQAWNTSAGWYFLTIKSKQTKAETASQKGQPYSLTYEIDLN